MNGFLPTSLLFITAFVAAAVLLALFQVRKSGLNIGQMFTAGWRGKAHPGIHVAKHGIGACFMAIFLLVAFVLTKSAQCTSGRDDLGFVVFDFSRIGCSKHLYGAYVVLTDWQSGIGAILALLGVGYAAILAALMSEQRIADKSHSSSKRN